MNFLDPDITTSTFFGDDTDSTPTCRGCEWALIDGKKKKKKCCKKYKKSKRCKSCPKG